MEDADAQADLRLCCSHMAKAGFVMTWLRYILQPHKSVILCDIKSEFPVYQWKMDDQDMPVVENTVHLGIARAK